MASCEYILDVANYRKIPPAPTRDDRENFGDVYFTQKQREHDLAKTGNTTKKFFLFAVRWFLEKQLKFKEISIAGAANEAPTEDVDGFKIVDGLASLTNEEKARFLAVAGILIADTQLDALSGKQPQMLSEAGGDVLATIVEGDGANLKSFKAYVAAPFKTALTRALSEFNTYPDLFQKVYEALRKGSKVGNEEYRFSARQIAVITRTLVAEKVSPSDPQFPAHFSRALSVSLSGATDGRASSIDIDLPDLEAGTEADIIIDNVKALSAIYFSAMLEEMKLFAVMDKVVEQFMTGAMPIKRSSAGDPLYRYHREAPLRINEFDRRGLYARSFGVAQGSVDEEMPNREFNDLWIRFLSAVSIYGREQDSTEMKRVSQEQIFKTARDLAVNLSYHGYGLAHFAAIELQSLIKNVKETLSHPDILASYGTRDVWQLCERVSNMYLGGAPNGVRHRTMAQSGAAIIQWLAVSSSSLIGSFANLNVDDGLRSNVERWLSVTGTPDQQTEKYSEPVALTSQPTIPSFAVPNGAGGDAIRDALARVNLPTTPQA
ncbi:MAG TPA: hypothetical protein VM261_16135 [Kofleriaceae bacterium]|nr:hypothetical protein [Kofleriaceae bacterium]